MYLVRSVQLSDLSHADNLRRGLLGHFSKPLDGSTDETRRLLDECESGFEKQVYSELFSRGYRVVPQVRAGSFRIDMVVEGANDTRLAIKCDGDEFHGPDRWAADMTRPRETCAGFETRISSRCAASNKRHERQSAQSAPDK